MASPLVHAQAVYPNRPIRLVVPYPPGALTDLLARTIAERMTAGLGQPIIIENKPGAGTLVGAEFVAKAPPDGYTLLMATSTTLGISPALYQPSPVNPVRDFAPIGQVGSVNFFLIANPAFPARTVREMIDAIKTQPGQVQLRLGRQRQPASPVHGDAQDASTALRSSTSRTRARPPRSPTCSRTAIQLMFCDATIALPNIQAGKVVALGTSAAKPTQLVAGVPPIAATVPGFDWQAWQGIVAPAGTPKDADRAAVVGAVEGAGERRVSRAARQVRDGAVSRRRRLSSSRR